MILFSIDQPRDFILAQILYHSCPEPMKLMVRSFRKNDQFNWSKPKNLGKNFKKEDMKAIKKYFPKKDIFFCTSYWSFKRILKKVDIFISRGREYWVLKPFAPRNIMLSLNRWGFPRLPDYINLYNDSSDHNMKIFLHSNLWLDRETMGGYMMSNIKNYEILDKVSHLFHGVDIYGEHYKLLSQISKAEIKQEFGISQFQKVVVLSFRKASDAFSIYENNDEFMNCVKSTLENLKKAGYFIISRRRLGQHDMAYYKSTKSPDISRFHEIENLVDLEVNGFGVYPDYIWRILYIADFLFLPDISGICYIESAICRCPVYMPFQDKKLFLKKFKNLCPAIIDMIEKDLIFNEISDRNIEYFHENIEKYLNNWYNTDINKFWDIVLN